MGVAKLRRGEELRSQGANADERSKPRRDEWKDDGRSKGIDKEALAYMKVKRDDKKARDDAETQQGPFTENITGDAFPNLEDSMVEEQKKQAALLEKKKKAAEAAEASRQQAAEKKAAEEQKRKELEEQKRKEAEAKQKAEAAAKAEAKRQAEEAEAKRIAEEVAEEERNAL